jgi:hypothetical protein
MAMKRYEVEVIHEPSGAYLNYSFDTDLNEDELDIYKDFIRDISIVVNDVEEIEDELDTIDAI